jgi:TetR/AcrR family transcriptional repressor of nem operon
MTTSILFDDAPYHDATTATARVLGYVAFRASLIVGEPREFTCLVGTMVQEAFDSNHEIRDACAASIFGHASTLEPDIDAALTDTARDAGVTAPDVARHIQVVLQGSFILAKASDDPTIVVDSLAHLSRYLTTILEPPTSTPGTPG